MSKHDDDHDGHHGATTIRASKGGGGGKWLIAAAAIAVLAGGGYFAWKNYGPGQYETQTAYNDGYADEYGNDPLRAGPVESNDTPIAESAATDDSVAPPASSESQRAAAARRSTTPRAQTAAAPEETIGIMPVNATADETVGGDDIVVTGPRRPVWVRTPNARRLSAYYPENALNRGREGEARLSCTVADNGALNCARVSETSSGFGRAAMRVARGYRHAATLADGRDAAGSPVNLRVVFRLADEDTRRG